MRDKVSIILPTFNEAGHIVHLIEAIIENLPNTWDYEILIVDDNSPDGTLSKVKEKFNQNSHIVPVLRTKDKGFAKSIREGIERSKGNFIIVMDSDYNHDPVEIPKMLHIAKIYDFVSCSRFCAGGGMQNSMHYYLSLGYNWFLRLLINTQVQDNLSGYFLINRKKIFELPFSEIFFGYGEYYLRLIYFCQMKKYSVLEIPTVYMPRLSGESKSNWSSMILNYTKAAITLKIKSRYLKKNFSDYNKTIPKK